MAELSAGTEAAFRVVRDGAEEDVTVAIGTRPLAEEAAAGPPAEPGESPRLGVSLATAMSDLPQIWSGTASIALFLPDSEAESVLRAARDLLRAEGFVPARSDRVGFRVAGTQVRYCSPAYAAKARRIAAALEGARRDFTAYSPKPPRGMIEVWLSGLPLARDRRPRRCSRPRCWWRETV